MKTIFRIAVFLWLGLSSLTAQQKTWVALGDSITYLNDHLDETAHRVSVGYMSCVVKKRSDLKYINHGYNGWTAIRVAENFEQLNIPKADYYTVFLGTNDWWAGNAIGTLDDYRAARGTTTFFGALQKIIAALKTLHPQAKIVLITPMQRTDFVYINNFKNIAYGSYQPKNNQSLEAFVRALLAVGREENIPVLDLYHQNALRMEKLVRFKRLIDPSTGKLKDYKYPNYVGLPFRPETDPYPYPLKAIGMTYDGLHPSDQGNRWIAKKLIPIFNRFN